MTSMALNADQRGGTGTGGLKSLTVDQAAAQLTRAGLSWSAGLGQGATVTYAFRATAPSEIPDGSTGFERLSSQQIDAIERALALWAKVADIHFVRVGSGSAGDGAYSDNATILFGGYTDADGDAAAFGILPGSTAASSPTGDVWINQSVRYMRYPGAQTDPGFSSIVHEIGHAIGLLHPGDYDADGQAITYAKDAAYAEDSLEYSIMSYFDLQDSGGAISDGRWQPAGPMIDDIAAAQRLYGPNLQSNSGNTVYGSNPYSSYLATGQGDQSGLLSSQNLPLWGTIWDGGGIDTLDFGGSNYAERIDLNAGHFSDVQGGVGTLSIALGVTIENAVGGNAGDSITGNAAANQLFGMGGNDTLVGGLGDDLLDGGAGTDRAVIAASYGASQLAVSDAGDVVTSSADGRDTLRAIETIVFTDRTLQTAPVTGSDGVYRVYMGRAAASGELSYWLGQIDAGRSLGDIRAAILSDPSGHAHTLTAVNTIYVDQMGRSASTAELGFWEGQVLSGTDFTGVRSAVAGDPVARAYTGAKIDAAYHDYFDRAASAGEQTYWSAKLTSGLTEAQFHSALASDWYAQSHVQQQVVEAYSFGLGRAPDTTETSYWIGQLRGGLSLHDMRSVIANDTTASGVSDAAVTSAYQSYMGRAPTTAELSYWNGQAHAGTGLDELRGAILTDAAGSGYITGKITGLYADYFGRAPSESEVQTWKSIFRDNGATTDALLLALAANPTGAGTRSYSAAPINSTTTLSGDFTHVVVRQFSNQAAPGADAYAGASVPPPGDQDVLNLRGTPFAGIDPLSHARDLVGLDGAHGVLISYDAGHDIVLYGSTLAQLAGHNFLF